MWKHLFLLLASFFPIAVCAQVKEPFDKYIAAVSQPGLGEVVPDLRFHNVLNYKKQQVRLSEFKGKAILIDFWASFCQPCLAQFPKLQGIQDKFQKELQVITITSDQQEKIVHMFNNIRSQGFKMLTATNDAKGSNMRSYVSFKLARGNIFNISETVLSGKPRSEEARVLSYGLQNISAIV